MAMAQVTWVVDRLKAWPSGVSLMYPPRKTAPSVRAAPTIDASTTLPGRSLYIHRPTSRAMGIVQAMVNVPHDEPETRRTEPAGIEASLGPKNETCGPPSTGVPRASHRPHFISVGVLRLKLPPKSIDSLDPQTSRAPAGTVYVPSALGVSGETPSASTSLLLSGYFTFSP